MKFSNTIKTVLKKYQKYVTNSVWFGTGKGGGGWGVVEKSVGNDDVSIVCARKYEMVRMT